MNRSLIFILLLSFQGLACGESLTEVASPYKIDFSAQDAKGTIWASAKASRLKTFDRGRWVDVSTDKLFASGRGAYVHAMVPMEDGGVAVFWQVTDETAALTRHEGALPPRLLATFPCSGLQYKSVQLLCDSRNRLWFALDQEIHWIAGHGEGRWRHGCYSIPQERFYGGNLRENGRNPLAFVEDSQGRVWVSGNPLAGAPNCSNLAGVLIFDRSDEPVWHRAFDGLGVSAFGMLSQKDETHLWLPVLGKGLFEIEIATLKVTPVSPPREGAFQRVAQVVPAAGAWLVIAGAPDRENWSLWRLKKGEWDCPVPYLATLREVGRSLKLPTPLGMFVALPGNPAWLLRNDEAIRLDWQAGMSANLLTGLFRLPNGETMLLDQKQSVLLKEWEPRYSTAGARFSEFKGGTARLAPDGHLWVSNEPHGMKEWDGKQWTLYDAPGEIVFPYQVGVMARDESGWFWLLQEGGDGPVTFFQPDQKRWLSYRDVGEALLSRRKNPPRWSRREETGNLPLYNGDGSRIALLRYQTILFYDGTEWQNIRATPLEKSPGVPFFDDKGELCLVTEESAWRLTKDRKWEARAATVAEEHAFQTQTQKPKDRSPSFAKDQRSLVLDNQGTYWGTSQANGVFKARAGRIAYLFARNEPDPFRGFREISEAWVDGQGNAFLRKGREKNWITLLPKSPAPQTQITLNQLAEDRWEAILEPHSPASKIEFLWQIDDAPRQLTFERKLRFDFLPAGKHRLTVSALDEELQADPAPAVAEWEVTLDAEAQLERTVAALGDPERRVAALEALALQPGRSVPALKKARLSAENDVRWWIEATLQEIERRASK